MADGKKAITEHHATTIKITNLSQKKTMDGKKIITEYHALQKRKAQIIKSNKLSEEQKAEQIKILELEFNQLGGIDNYQRSSLSGEAKGKFNSSLWVCNKLSSMKKLEKGNRTLLDVGSIVNHYSSKPAHLNVTCIDLNPQGEDVLKSDFFDYSDVCKTQGKRFDVVVLSLVLNFVGDINKRGEMIQACNKLLNDKGLLFIVLPLACVDNSRYMNEELFTKICSSLFFKVVESSRSEKLFMSILEKVGESDIVSEEFKRTLLRGGTQRNNFTMTLRKEEKVLAVNESKRKATTSNQRKRARKQKKKQIKKDAIKLKVQVQKNLSSIKK